MQRFRTVFRNSKPVIGMIHVEPLPGTPKYGGSVEKLVESACLEAEIYKSCNVSSVMVENMHDVPYVRSVDFTPEVVSVMTRVASEVRKIMPESTPCGIQVLAGGNKEGIAVAKACNFQYVRVEGFVFSHIGDEGFFDASAGTLLRYRKLIDAESILVFTDIKKKHSSHSITSDVSVEETAKAAEFFLSDGVILTGGSTASPADLNELKRTKEAVHIPVLIGSGVTKDNINQYINADGFIVGSHFKKDGRWENKLEKDKILAFMEKIYCLQESSKGE